VDSNDAMQEQRFTTMATHHLLDGMSGQASAVPTRLNDGVLEQCSRARDGQDGAGPNYMTMPF
jgi:hypothetical protein